MEDDKKTKESTYTLDNKHFWAAFLNLARHNVYITVNHINKILGEGEINRDGLRMLGTKLKILTRKTDSAN